MAANAILAISSTDRYISNGINGKANQPTSSVLLSQYEGRGPYSNDFSITAPNALMNGYIEKVIISQIQLQYNLPTIQPGNNDVLPIYLESSLGSGTYFLLTLPIPYGFYLPQELAAILQAQLNFYVLLNAPWSVKYSSSALFTNTTVGFYISSNLETPLRWFFPTPDQLRLENFSETEITAFLKTYRLFGFNQINSQPNTFQQSYVAPEFLYTPYIDIYSDALTNYQKLKDSDSSIRRSKGLIARLYLSGVGNPQPTTSGFYYNRRSGGGGSTDVTETEVQGSALGSAPFVLTFDLNSPKIINWTPDTAINSLDFQMRDCYGDLLFCFDQGFTGQAKEVFNTEFQMTLLCVEKR